MNVLNPKSLVIPKILLTVSFLSVAYFSTAQMNPSVEALVNQLRNNGYPFEVDVTTGDVAVPNQIVLHFRAGTMQQWKDEFKQNFENNLSESFGVRIFMQLVKKCNCETIESWELMTPSGAFAFCGDKNKKDKTTTTGKETASGAQGGDNLEAIDVNYYQTVGEGGNFEPSNLSLNLLMGGIIPNNSEHRKVEFIDTGVDPIHPNQDFRNALWSDPNEGTDMNADLNNNCQPGDKLGWNFVDNNNLPLDFHSHGTHVAGIIYKNSGCVPVKLLTAKALNNQGIGLDIDIACAIHYGIQQEVDAMNASFGRTGSPSAIVEKAVQKAIAKEIVFVAAAGNYLSDNDATPMWPANFPNVISVNAHQETNTAVLWQSPTQIGIGANFGINTVHIATEGENVYSTIPGGYQRKSGTSMASPKIAAAAVIQKYHNLGATVNDIRKKLFSNTILQQPYNQQNYNGYGVLLPSLCCYTPFPDENTEEIVYRRNHSSATAITTLEIAPNPVTDISMITIDYNGQESSAELILMDLTGKILLQKKMILTGKKTQEPLIIHDLPNGIYFAKILIGKTILSKKIVKL